ncbi:unnamed protein product [Vicia faba]|uniref:Uncharacterized protein n=1 Tax=Vicia faba TaxID=3906 RepID=A0AAV0YNU8_VICFA|nr:unnamed protein product [Vicia faba]
MVIVRLMEKAIMLLHCHPDGYAKAKGAGTSDTKVETISKESDRRLLLETGGGEPQSILQNQDRRSESKEETNKLYSESIPGEREEPCAGKYQSHSPGAYLILGLELQLASSPLFSRGPPAKRKEASICPIPPEKECRFWIPFLPARSSFLPMHSFYLGSAEISPSGTFLITMLGSKDGF